MTNKVEELERGVSEVRSQLFELKDNITLSAQEKKEQANTLKSKADALSREIDAELAVLSSSTDADAQKNIEKLVASQDILREIQDLYASILTSLES
jgi:Mg2+ and Co2+ transporter CorA